MEESLQLWLKGVGSGTKNTPEFLAFARAFKREFKKELESVNATKIKFSVGHFYISGIYTIGTQAWYFSLSDIRYFQDKKILYRTVESYQDYSGNMNQYAKIEVGMGKKMHKPKMIIK